MSGKLSLVCLAASLAFAGSALANDRADQRRNGSGRATARDYGRNGDRRYQAPGREWGSHGHEIIEREVVIPAQYETIRERVWIEPVYEWVTREVWVPKRRGRRHLNLRIGNFSLSLGGSRHHGHHRGRGFYETIREQVLVHEGHYETITRSVLVRPERIEIVQKTVSVGRGYWNGLGGYAGTTSHGRSGRGAIGRRGIGRRPRR